MFRSPLFLLLSAVLLAGCQNIEIPLDSRVALPSNYDHAQATHEAEEIAIWWQNWQDPVLNHLIEQGLHGSYDIQIAQSRLNESRATARLARADLAGQVGFTANASYQKLGVDNPLNAQTRDMLASLPSANSSLTSDTIQADSGILMGGLSASWEPDIFGKKRSDADAARFGAQARQEEVYGAQILLVGDVAKHYFQARAIQHNMRHTENSIAVLQQMLRYVQQRFQAGHVTAYEVNEAHAALTAMQGKQATLKAQFATHERAIAILIGQIPQNFSLAESKIDVLAQQPAAPQGHTPSGLLERRPDLRARVAVVQAQAAKLASAKADWYPRFSIHFMGQGGRIELDGDSALSGWSNLISVGITMPIFTAGRIQANIDSADARLQTALLEYDKTLLQALADVENAYHMQYALTKQTQYLQQSAAQYAKQANDANQLFRYGDKTLDESLRARLNAYQAAENLTQSQLARAQALVGLYQALGGGWQIKYE